MSISLDNVTLPDDLRWEDQSLPGWAQNTERLVDGRLLIEETPYQGGIPITLSSRDNFGIYPASTLTDVLAKVARGAEMTLSGLTEEDILVTWRLSDGDPVEWDYLSYPAELYRVTLRFITVEAP